MTGVLVLNIPESSGGYWVLVDVLHVVLYASIILFMLFKKTKRYANYYYTGFQLIVNGVSMIGDSILFSHSRTGRAGFVCGVFDSCVERDDDCCVFRI